VKPQLATLVDAPPAGNEWLHEIKLDGYRAIASVAGERVVIRTRNALDWTRKFAPLVPPLAGLPCHAVLLDGEIAVADEEGRTDFGALQEALSAGSGGFGYYLFDLLHLDGEDLRSLPLIERKEKLRLLLEGTGSPLLYSDHIEGDAALVYSHACDLKLEGIVSKKRNDVYRSGRGKSWLKVKCGMEQEFVIIGWRPSDKAGRPFSSLLLAVHEEGKLRYAGRVGTGYSGARLGELAKRFKCHAREDPPVDDVPRAIVRHARFVDPVLVAEISFRGWTKDGVVRQASFKGLRADKPARQIVREKAMPKAQAVKLSKAESVEAEGIRITHPDRVVFPGQGVTKRDLIDYYRRIAGLILPHIADRPLSLVRCPQGREKECFFQKHASPGWPDELRKVRIREKSGADDYLYVEDLAGIVAAVQMGVLELHVWGAHVDRVEKPDRMVFDLDPDEGLPFARVKEAALDLKKRLENFDLESFPMATGGKGVHVVVPLAPKHSWDEHRSFAEALARLMEEENPGLYIANMSKKKRQGRIFVDYLRNQRGSTAICPYSTRARKGAYIAAPVSWRGLGTLKNAHPFGVKDAAKIARAGDPWKGYRSVRQSLPKF